MRNILRKETNKPHRGQSLKKLESGQSAVEVAFCVPFLILVLCAIIDFGWIFMNQYAVQNATFEGARYAAMYAGTTSDSTLILNAKDRVRGSLIKDGSKASITVVLGSSDAVVSVEYPVKTLTFVGGTYFGDTYKAKYTSYESYSR